MRLNRIEDFFSIESSPPSVYSFSNCSIVQSQTTHVAVVGEMVCDNRSARSRLSSCNVFCNSARVANARIFCSYASAAPGVAPCSVVRVQSIPIGDFALMCICIPAPHRPHSWKTHLFPNPNSPCSPRTFPHRLHIFRKLRDLGRPLFLITSS